MHRLAARDVPPGGSSSGTQNQAKTDVSPGGDLGSPRLEPTTMPMPSQC